MNTNLPHLRSVRSPSLLACATLLAGFSVSLSAQTFIFQEGLNDYAGTSDTYIASHPNGSDNINYGTSDVLSTRYTNTEAGLTINRENRNTLIRFDDLGLSGSVTSASITLTVASINGNAGQGDGGSTEAIFLAYELQSSWTESNATWNSSSSGVSWQSSGARGAEDRILTPIFTSQGYMIHNPDVSKIQLATGDTITIDLPTSLVQAWLDDPSSNYGILLSVGASSKNRYPNIAFHSSEAADIDLRPQLTINGDFGGSQIPEPSSAAALLGLGGLATAALRRNRRRD